MTTEDHAAGVALFNTGQFWHAHEAWEQCWHAAHEPDASFYKGLIQAAAALVHWQRGNPTGLRRNWAKARRFLIVLPGTYRTIDVQRLCDDMDRFVDADGNGLAPRLHERPDHDFVS